MPKHAHAFRPEKREEPEGIGIVRAGNAQRRYVGGRDLHLCIFTGPMVLSGVRFTRLTSTIGTASLHPRERTGIQRKPKPNTKNSFRTHTADEGCWNERGARAWLIFSCWSGPGKRCAALEGFVAEQKWVSAHSVRFFCSCSSSSQTDSGLAEKGVVIAVWSPPHLFSKPSGARNILGCQRRLTKKKSRTKRNQ